MKLGTQRGKGLYRMDAIKQAIILFIDVIICDGFLSLFHFDGRHGKDNDGARALG